MPLTSFPTPLSFLLSSLFFLLSSLPFLLYTGSSLSHPRPVLFYPWQSLFYRYCLVYLRPSFSWLLDQWAFCWFPIPFGVVGVLRWDWRCTDHSTRVSQWAADSIWWCAGAWFRGCLLWTCRSRYHRHLGVGGCIEGSAPSIASCSSLPVRMRGGHPWKENRKGSNTFPRFDWFYSTGRQSDWKSNIVPFLNSNCRGSCRIDGYRLVHRFHKCSHSWTKTQMETDTSTESRNLGIVGIFEICPRSLDCSFLDPVSWRTDGRSISSLFLRGLENL